MHYHAAAVALSSTDIVPTAEVATVVIVSLLIVAVVVTLDPQMPVFIELSITDR